MYLIGVAGVGGGFLYQAPQSVWFPYLILNLRSVFALMSLGIWADGIWLTQLRSIAILIKVITLLCVLVLKNYASYVLIIVIVIVIVISGIIAHTPGNARYLSIFHGRRIENLYDSGQEDSTEGI